MPYITQERRISIEESLAPLLQRGFTPGELNYVITRIINSFIGAWPTYDDFNDAVGVLGCVKMELYRRAVAPYEDVKREKNGDVF